MWHHRPTHIFEPEAFYMVTAGTMHKQHFFRGDDRLELLQSTLEGVLSEYQWEAQSWALFSNHYHFIAKAPSNAATLKRLIQKLHSITAREINRLDRVWSIYIDGDQIRISPEVAAEFVEQSRPIFNEADSGANKIERQAIISLPFSPVVFIHRNTRRPPVAPRLPLPSMMLMQPGSSTVAVRRAVPGT